MSAVISGSWVSVRLRTPRREPRQLVPRSSIRSTARARPRRRSRSALTSRRKPWRASRGTLPGAARHLCADAGAGRSRGAGGNTRPILSRPELMTLDQPGLHRPAEGSEVDLFPPDVILDVFSRCVVGKDGRHRESSQLAERLIQHTCESHAIRPGQLTLHADRGSSMKSKPVARCSPIRGHEDPRAPPRLRRQPRTHREDGEAPGGSHGRRPCAEPPHCALFTPAPCRGSGSRREFRPAMRDDAGLKDRRSYSHCSHGATGVSPR